MRDYRQALFADMKAIGKFGLCSRSVTLQVIVFLFKNQDVQEY